MITMKKTAIAAALGFALVSGAAQSAVTNFAYTGSFLMYDGTDPINYAQFDHTGSPQQYMSVATSTTLNPNYNPNYNQYIGPLSNGHYSSGAIMDNGNGMAGDPISGTMAIDMSNGAGSATMAGTPFFGSSWSAYNVNFTGIGPGLEHATMLFAWGVPDATTTCGLANCDIHVAVDFQMYPSDALGNFDAAGTHYGFYTVGSWMFDGPFVGAQATFSGVATPAAVPVPAAAWLLGSGLLGLVGVARRKVAVA